MHADGIGGNNTELSTMDDSGDHPSVLTIIDSRRSTLRMFDFKRACEEHVQEVLEKLDANKDTGYDTFPIKMMKIGATELAYPVSTLFNACIEKGKWPAERKKGE